MVDPGTQSAQGRAESCGRVIAWRARHGAVGEHDRGQVDAARSGQAELAQHVGGDLRRSPGDVKGAAVLVRDEALERRQLGVEQV